MQTHIHIERHYVRAERLILDVLNHENLKTTRGGGVGQDTTGRTLQSLFDWCAVPSVAPIVLKHVRGQKYIDEVPTIG